MDSTGLLQLFRVDMDDLETPYLWTDIEAFSYMTDAQEQFCRKTEGIADSRTLSVCQIAVVAPEDWYPKSPLILKVRGCTRDDTGGPVEVINPEHLNEATVRFNGKDGVIKCVVDGLTDGFFRIYPIPSETVNLSLQVFRLPLVELTDVDQPIEIASHHHRALLWWMRHLAYDKQDADTYDAKRSAEYEQRFDKYCYKALAEQERARRKVGVTTYGGIGGGTAAPFGTDDYHSRWPL